MFFNGLENSKRLWTQYGIILLAIAVGAFSVLAYIVSSYTETIQERTVQSLVAQNQKDASVIEAFLNRGETALNVTSRTVETFLQRNAPQAQIESLLVSEFEYYLGRKNNIIGNLFGVIQGDFYSGGKWTPSVGYVPSRRPWYQDAFLTRGATALVATHMVPHKNLQVVSLSKRLSDKKSVIALDLYLKDLQACVSAWEFSDIWMLLDKNGLVVTHSNVTHQGRNYLSSEFWGTDEEKLAREILIANGKPFSFRYGHKEYLVISALVKDKWYMVRLIDSEALWHEMDITSMQNVGLAVVMYLLLTALMTFCFFKFVHLLRVNRSKTGFLNNMCREIRTMVTGMLGMNSIVLKEVHDAGLKDYVKNVQSAGQGILSLVNDVLDVFKIESGKMNIVSMEYDVFSILQDCYNENVAKARAKNLRFTMDCNPDIPSSLWGDEGRIRQILNNLLSNAIKFTEVGEVTLSVNFDHLPPIGGLKSDDYVMLKFVIKDTGVGIRKEDLSGIFEKYQSNEDSPEMLEGMGIGLSLTKSLVAKCGGQISVSSRFGEGSSFTVKIPQLVLNIEPMGDFAIRYRNVSRKKNGDNDLFLAPEARVLIVDDVEMNLKVLCGFMKGTLAQVDTAVSGEQCLVLVQSKHYDLIFLDHQMPVMDGLDTYRKMQKLEISANKETPVIALTSEGYDDAKDSLLSAGFTDYLPKPIKERDLLRALKWYLPKQKVLSMDDLQDVLDNGTDNLEGHSQSWSAKEESMAANEDVELRVVTNVKPRNVFDSLQGILDIKAGLDYCADDGEIYFEMLQEYVASPISRNVESCYKNGEWDNYRFYTHVLCDASSAIGAMEMAESFRELENACRESRMTFVRSHHELAMAMHAELIHKIQRGIE